VNQLFAVMNGMEALVPLFVFGGIVAGIWVVLSTIAARNSRAEKRLDKYSRTPTMANIDIDVAMGKTRGEKMQGLVEKAISLSKPLMPKTELEQNKLRVKLANAGFRSEKAVSVYMGIKMAFLVLMLLVGFVIFVPRSGLSFSSLKWLALFAGVGLYGPAILLWWLVRKRQQAIFLTLPDALDLMVVCVESGLGLDAAMRRVTDEMKEHAPIMCEELAIANFQLNMGRPRRDVLHDLGVRTGVDDVRSLAAILIQADRFGSSVAQALRVQSDSMRMRRKQIAEEKAAKTAVTLIFPLVLFIFPGIFVVLVGPAAIVIGQTLVTK
jgi:tight adherence protein C